MQGHVSLAVWFVVAIGFACPVAAERRGVAPWPQFLGPTGAGHAEATHLPLEWGPDENIAWRAEIPGEGWSSPVIGDGYVIVTTAVEQDRDGEPGRSLRVISLDLGSAETLWNVEVFHQPAASEPTIHRKNSHASPTPLIHEGKIYVHFGHQGTACLNERGEILWKTTELAYDPVHGNGGSPALVENALIFSGDGRENPFVAALDRDTGDVLWRTPRESDAVKKFSFCTPCVIDVDGRTQVVSPGSNCVGGYDPRTGEELWRVDYEGYSVVPRPVHGHGLIFMSTCYDSPIVLAIRAGGRGNVTDTHVAWTLKRGAPHTPSPLLVGNELYLLSDRGISTCVDALSGEIHWQERMGGNYSASPIYAEGHVYCLSEEGNTTVFRATAEGFQLVSQNDLNERSLASFAVAERAIFLRTARHLYRIGEHDRPSP